MRLVRKGICKLKLARTSAQRVASDSLFSYGKLRCHKRHPILHDKKQINGSEGIDDRQYKGTVCQLECRILLMLGGIK